MSKQIIKKLNIDTNGSEYKTPFTYRGEEAAELVNLQSMLISSIHTSDKEDFINKLDKYLKKLHKKVKENKPIKAKLIDKIFDAFISDAITINKKEIKAFIKRPKTIGNHLDDAIKTLIDNSPGATFWQKFNNNADIIIERFRMILEDTLKSIKHNLLIELNTIDEKLDSSPNK